MGFIPMFAIGDLNWPFSLSKALTSWICCSGVGVGTWYLKVQELSSGNCCVLDADLGCSGDCSWACCSIAAWTLTLGRPQSAQDLFHAGHCLMKWLVLQRWQLLMSFTCCFDEARPLLREGLRELRELPECPEPAWHELIAITDAHLRNI